MPKELGGDGEGTNPEQLFAVGFASCFENALQIVARRKKLEVGDTSVASKVMLLPSEERGFQLAVEMDVTLPSIEDIDQAKDLVRTGAQGLPLLERDARQHRRRLHGERRVARRLTLAARRRILARIRRGGQGGLSWTSRSRSRRRPSRSWLSESESLFDSESESLFDSESLALRLGVVVVLALGVDRVRVVLGVVSSSPLPSASSCSFFSSSSFFFFSSSSHSLLFSSVTTSGNAARRCRSGRARPRCPRAPRPGRRRSSSRRPRRPRP